MANRVQAEKCVNKHLIIVACMVTVIAMAFFVGCKNEDKAGAAENPLEGTWKYIGIAEASEDGGDPYDKYNLITRQDLADDTGHDVNTDTQELVIDESGIANSYSGIPGGEIGQLEKLNDQQYRQKIIIKVLDGKELEEPLEEEFLFTLKDGYLFLEVNISDDEYDGGSIQVYEKG